MKFRPLEYSDKYGSVIDVYEGPTRVSRLEVRVIRQGDHTIREMSEAVVADIMQAFQAVKTVDELRAEQTARQHSTAPAAIGDLTDIPGQLLEDAYSRIFDMLHGDDGEAFFQAEAFLKRNKPDLYNRIPQERITSDGSHHS